MSRLGFVRRLPGIAALATLAVGGVVAPAVADTSTVRVSGMVTVGGQPSAGATVTLGTAVAVSEGDGTYSVDVPSGTTALTLDVATPHDVRDTSASYHGTLDLTADRTLDLAVPGDRATTMTVTEADGSTPVVRAEYDLFHGPGVKLVPAVGPFDYVTDVQHGADDAVTDDAGHARFYVPDWSTTDHQTATLTVWDPHYLRPGVSTQVAYPATPAEVALAFPPFGVASAPQGLVVDNVTPQAARFRWSASTSDGGSRVTAYRVTYGQTGAAGRTLDVPATGGTVEEVRVTDLVPGRQYEVEVRAVNAAGVSAPARGLFSAARFGVQARIAAVSPSAPVSGQPVTLTVDVSGGGSAYVPTGTVTVYDGGAALGSATLSNGRASLTKPLTAGTHTLTVGYAGDATHLPAPGPGSSSPAYSLVVGKAATSTSVTTSATGKGNARDVTVRVDVRALAPGGGTPTGTVTVRDSATGQTRTLSATGGTLSTTYAGLRTKQTVTFTVTYGGSADFGGSTASASVKL